VLTGRASNRHAYHYWGPSDDNWEPAHYTPAPQDWYERWAQAEKERTEKYVILELFRTLQRREWLLTLCAIDNWASYPSFNRETYLTTGFYRENKERKAAEARTKKIANEKQAMGWLIRQQVLLKEVVRLGLEIDMAEAVKGGSYNGEPDATPVTDADDEFEEHTIFVSHISVVVPSILAKLSAAIYMFGPYTDQPTSAKT
jgi:hypothetical protein